MRLGNHKQNLLSEGVKTSLISEVPFSFEFQDRTWAEFLPSRRAGNTTAIYFKSRAFFGHLLASVISG